MSLLFFEPTVALGKEVQWTFTFIIDAEGNIKGSCAQRALGLNSKLLNNVHPLRFGGTARELDAGLLAQITAPVAKVMDLVQNITTHEKAIAVASKQLEDEKAKAAQKTNARMEVKGAVKPPEKDARTKKYELQMKKVDDLEGEGKPGQALAALPKITDYPEKKAEITAKTNALRTKRGDLDLFSSGARAEDLPTTAPGKEPTQPATSGDVKEGEGDEEPQDPGPWEEPAEQGGEAGSEEADEEPVHTEASIQQ